MKTILTFLIAFCFAGLSYGQVGSNGDYKTTTDGTWEDVSWLKKNFLGVWASTTAPTTNLTSGRTYYINNNVDLDGPTVNYLKMQGATIVIAEGFSLTIPSTRYIDAVTGGVGIITTANASGLILQSNASGTANLISNSSPSGTLECYVTKGGWHLIGPPFNTTAMAFHTGYMQTWADGDPGVWTVQDGAAPAINRGVGAAYYFIPQDYTASFAGVLSGTAPSSVALSNAGGADDGWHLLANPFPCALNLTGVFTGDFSSTYQVYVQGSSYQPATTIGASQGFFVQVGAGGATADFAGGTKVVNNMSISKSQETDFIQLKLSDNAGTSADQLTVRFNELATFDYEGEFDGHKIIGNPIAGEIMAQITDEEFACVLGIPFTEGITTVKVNFKKGDANEYTLELAQNLLTNMDVSLEDTETNMIVDLNTTPSYTFAAEDSRDARFLLHFKNATSIQELINYDNIRVWESNDFLNIDQDVPQKGYVEIYDISGKQLFNTAITESSNQKVSIANLADGVYVVKVIVGNDSYSQKIIK